MQIVSPVTGQPNVELFAKFSPCVTSDSKLSSGAAENYFCVDTGLLFNAAGPRGRETGFYQDEYELLAEDKQSEFFHFDDGKAIALSDNMINFIRSNVSLPTSGRMLEIGCGKGLLLHRFRTQYPEWNLSAIEPSKNAKIFFAKNMPDLAVFEGPFESSPFANEQFDFVQTNGVLEHVPNPLDYLKRLRACLKEGAHAFVGVPNFATNPADLLTFDHLSRLTPNVTVDLIAMAGLEVVASAVPDSRIPMWFIVRRGAATTTARRASLEAERAIAEQAKRFVSRSFEACDRAAKAAAADGKALAWYGTGAIAFAATAYSSMKIPGVSAIYEDNASLWGAERLGIPIRPSDELKGANVGHLVLNANPCYFDTIRRRIHALVGDSVAVYDGAS